MRLVLLSAAVIAALIGMTSAKVYFKDNFDTDPFESKRWVVSSWKKDTGEAGEMEYSGGVWPATSDRKGIRTTQDARFYAASAMFDEEFDNTDKSLVFQFSVKHEQKMDCGGGYLKLLKKGFDQDSFNGDSEYAIMFGPDICGYSTKKIHAIFNHDGKNKEKTSDVATPEDEMTHVFTLIVNADDTYEIRLDGEKKDSGKLKDAWEFENPKKIKDPKASKPSDWVDEEQIDDPEDVKPDDWDSEPEKISDPDATKPDDWDDEDDGEWEAPMIDNPEFKGVWKAKKIANPDYKGPWVHPEIDNPDYEEVNDVYKRGTTVAVGFEVWQVKSGTVFGDVIVTDSVEEADEFYNANKVDKSAEEAAKKAYDEANKPAEPETETTSGDDDETEADLDADDDDEDKTEL